MHKTSYKSKKNIKTKDGETTTLYEYSDKALKERGEKKVDKVNLLKDILPDIVSDCKEKLKSKDPKESMTALAVLLIDHTYERVGNEGSAENGHHGVTTWEIDHLSFKGDKAFLKYVGKSGVDHIKEITDKSLVKALKDLKSKSDKFLFQNDEAGVSAADVNEYLKEFDITAKDIRGYHANRLVQEKLKKLTPVTNEDKKKQESERKKQFIKIVEEAAEEVGHEPTTLRNQYLAPSLEDDFLDDGKVNNTVKAMKKETIDKLASEYVSETLINKLASGFSKTSGEIRHIRDTGPAKRLNVRHHNYKPKDLKDLTKILWHISVGLGHVSSGMNQLARKKSIHISPDGRLGGKGYDKSIVDIRKDLYTTVEFLSAIQDTLFDEISGPHWSSSLKKLPTKDQNEVKELIDEVEVIREDPEAFGNDDEETQKSIDELQEEEKENNPNPSIIEEEE